MSLLCQLLCFGNVRILRFLVASDEEENQQASHALKIDPVTWTVIDAKFADAFTAGLYVSEVAQRKAANADLDASPCILVAQLTKPIGEDFGLANLDRLLIIVHVMILVKQFR